MNEKNLDKNEKNLLPEAPFLPSETLFVENYKNSTKPLEETLRFNLNPSTKLILLCMIIHKEESYTTSELNFYLNRKYTFENYQKALQEFIDRKSIEIVNKKVGSRLRSSFKINYERYCNEE